MKFTLFRKNCKHKAYNDDKCVNPENKQCRMVGSCTYPNCPLKQEMAEKKVTE